MSSANDAAGAVCHSTVGCGAGAVDGIAVGHANGMGDCALNASSATSEASANGASGGRVC
jgi:hypothetical protein